MPTKSRRDKKLLFDELKNCKETLSVMRGLFKVLPLSTASVITSNFATVSPDDPTGEVFLHPKIGLGGNQSRSDDRRDLAIALKKQYPEFWGARNGPKEIARRGYTHPQTLQHHYPHPETIRRMFKAFP